MSQSSRNGPGQMARVLAAQHSIRPIDTVHTYFGTKEKNGCTTDPQSCLVGLRSGKVAVGKTVTLLSARVTG